MPSLLAGTTLLNPFNYSAQFAFDIDRVINVAAEANITGRFNVAQFHSKVGDCNQVVIRYLDWRSAP